MYGHMVSFTLCSVVLMTSGIDNGQVNSDSAVIKVIQILIDVLN